MAHVVIVGCGNPFCSDDAVGIRAAQQLLETPLPPGTEVFCRHQLTPDLADAIQNAEVVVFVDAARGGTPGEVRCAPVHSTKLAAPFTHELTPASLMSLVAALDGISPPAFEVSLSGECFRLGDELSTVVAQALPSLIELVVSILDEPFTLDTVRSHS